MQCGCPVWISRKTLHNERKEGKESGRNLCLGWPVGVSLWLGDLTPVGSGISGCVGDAGTREHWEVAWEQ